MIQHSLVKNSLCYFLGLFVFLAAINARAYTPEDCVRCHKEGSRESMLHVSMGEFEDSIHGRETTCQDCHTGIRDESHETVKGSGAVDCSMCHDQENRHGMQSKTEHRPRCYSCHTAHAIFEINSNLSSVHRENLNKTCGTCHPAECGDRDYLSWLPSKQIASHNKQDFGCPFEEDNCLGCHQGMAAHGEEAPINEETCYQCHFSPEGDPLLVGYIHPKAHPDKHPTIFASAIIYLFVILAVFYGGFMFYTRKFSGKSRRHRR